MGDYCTMTSFKSWNLYNYNDQSLILINLIILITFKNIVVSYYKKKGHDLFLWIIKKKIYNWFCKKKLRKLLHWLSQSATRNEKKMLVSYRWQYWFCLSLHCHLQAPGTLCPSKDKIDSMGQPLDNVKSFLLFFFFLRPNIYTRWEGRKKEFNRCPCVT